MLSFIITEMEGGGASEMLKHMLPRAMILTGMTCSVVMDGGSQK